MSVKITFRKGLFNNPSYRVLVCKLDGSCFVVLGGQEFALGRALLGEIVAGKEVLAAEWEGYSIYISR